MKRAGLLLVAPAALLLLGADDPGIKLQSPIACAVGSDCWIQSYPDHDPGPGARDGRCGSQTYDGHDGTDFRIADMAVQKQGVNVLAAAKGVVRNLRDGVDDISIRAANAPDISGRECGNGVVIVHANGWETQYCHMAKGSLAVKSGQAVEAGTVLGRVGLSGDTEFPHLHFSLRHNGQKLDPFNWDQPMAQCSVTPHSLWDKRLAASFAYRPVELIRSGFASGEVDTNAILQATVSTANAHSPFLVAYAQIIHLEGGDKISLTLKGPDGNTLAETSTPPMNRPKAQYLVFAGPKLKQAAWPKGRYLAEVTVLRRSVPVLKRQFSIQL
jgi:hypothetical protein